ncbi:hypothetical protein J5N97_013620 [Dioscorea zingiberensis]|uniref:Uncharacterized protein n=1 Tax=Dioscorea zingiberensis TaxID=325984 RepID=A0A9D5CR48_9LILI|nr:hypothetical protein J5N97_013620 [Dioscorea zingiberensis]
MMPCSPEAAAVRPRRMPPPYMCSAASSSAQTASSIQLSAPSSQSGEAYADLLLFPGEDRAPMPSSFFGEQRWTYGRRDRVLM